MKQTIHPTNYRPVVFQDLNNETIYLTKSTVSTNETIEYEGKTYPLVKIHISSSSHPFFTGEERILDIEGRVDKFKAKTQAALRAKEMRMASATKKSKRMQQKIQKQATKI